MHGLRRMASRPFFSIFMYFFYLPKGIILLIDFVFFLSITNEITSDMPREEHNYALTASVNS